MMASSAWINVNGLGCEQFYEGMSSLECISFFVNVLVIVFI